MKTSHGKLNANVLGVAAGLAGLLMAVPSAYAVEAATSFYILGSKTTMSGYLPPPGAYGFLSNYVYSGSADIDFESAGIRITGGIDADAYIAMPTGLWVLNEDILGGNLAFSLTAPFAGKKMEAGAFISPSGTQLNAKRDNWAFGDPVFGTTLGWHDGKMHYTLGALVNIPVGQWELGNPVNIGFNRWVVDATAAMTYLDPTTGLELSGAAGITFNFENPDTNYESGTEIHGEAAAMLHLSHTFSIGLNGYAYKQITGDSGSGAVLGAFKGQVFAVGPALDYTFKIGQLPVATNLRYFYEFGVDNRLKGHAGLLSFAVPLGGHSAEQSSH